MINNCCYKISFNQGAIATLLVLTKVGSQNAAVMAMCKFMLVSSSLCENNIQLLFTLLEKSNDEKARCNIMILLHDLIIRFVKNFKADFSDILLLRGTKGSFTYYVTTTTTTRSGRIAV